MTPLRQRMIEDMQLRGFSARTQECYVAAVLRSYYLVTFPLPKELRALALRNPRQVYGLLMRLAVAALQKLAADSRDLGGRLGCLAVLHTWTRALLCHPHVHALVTAGGLSADGTRWMKPKNHAFLVPARALSILFRAKLCAALKKTGLLEQVSPQVWGKNWVVHCQPAGSGQKVLTYLARYVFRIALSNSRLEKIDSSHVTFRYRDNQPTDAAHHSARHRVYPPLSLACVASALYQGPSLWNLQ